MYNSNPLNSNKYEYINIYKFKKLIILNYSSKTYVVNALPQ